MKILFLVHVEKMFESFFPMGYYQSIMEEIEEQKFDRVIGLFSYIEDIEPPIDIVGWIDEEWEWSWGYEPEQFEDWCECSGNDDSCEWCEDKKWLIPAYGHEYTWVPPEIRNGRFNNDMSIFIAGGHDSECLQDWRDVLDYVGLRYAELRQLIY